jgi:hypothetical protein
LRLFTSRDEYAEVAGAVPFAWILKYFFFSLSAVALIRSPGRILDVHTIIKAWDGSAVHLESEMGFVAGQSSTRM